MPAPLRKLQFRPSLNLLIVLAGEFCVKLPRVMPSPKTDPVDAESFLQRHSGTAYFLWTFAISWSAAFVVAAPHLLRGQPLPK
jgi:hypothetical protein